MNRNQKLPLPSKPLVYAELAQNAYYPGKAGNLPPGFNLFMECPVDYRWWGYFGKSFFKINEETKTIEFVIAHRGTNNAFGIVEDIELWLKEILPAQYEDGAKPFMELAIREFKKFAKRAYPEYNISYQVTGHSLGAALSQKTLLDANSSQISYPPMTGMLFENPGIPPDSPLLKNKDGSVIDPALILNYKKNTVLVNNRKDSINTLYKTNCDHEFVLNTDNEEYPHILGLPLPFAPNLLYYAAPYSFEVIHPISNSVNDLLAKNANLNPMINWPYSLEGGYKDYINYDKNKKYWNGYMSQLWNHNGLETQIIRKIFNDSYFFFSSFYKFYFLSNSPTCVEKAVTDLRKISTADELWSRLSKDQYGIFDNDVEKFKVWLEKFYVALLPKEYPIINNFQKTIKNEISLLIKHTQQNLLANESSLATQMRFDALNDLNSRLMTCKAANTSMNESILIAQSIKQTCVKFQLDIKELTGFSCDYIAKKLQVSQDLLELNSFFKSYPQKPLQTKCQARAYTDDLFRKYNVQSSDPEINLYIKTINEYLENRFKALPSLSDKYFYFKEIKNIVDELKDPDIACLKAIVDRIKNIASDHRNKSGLKGYLNQHLFKETDSLKQLKKYFDDNNNIKEKKSSIIPNITIGRFLH